ncbi:hypothetical protein EDB83DRAFT_2309959 [Lactarius deliciosus]|nr:hypothetical protein EDB83DRAFT_2309959 [Lactarius deliciosus]
MSTNISAPPSGDSGQSVPTLNRIRIRAGEKISASDINKDMLEGLRVPVPNGTASDNTLALNEIQLALSNISSNLGKLVPVERRHVVPPAIAALVHLVFLVLISQPIENIISAVFFTIMLTGFAWPVWTTLKPMHRRLDEINNRQHHNGKLWTQSIESKEVPQPVMQDEFPMNFEEPEPFRVSVTVSPEPERDDEPPAIVDEREPASVTLEPTVSEPPASADLPDPIQAPAETKVLDGPPATTDKPDPIPHHQNLHASNERSSFPSSSPTQRPESSFGHWSSTLLEIKHRIEPLASDTLQRLPQSNQRGPFDLFALRRIALRLLMYCASIPTADFATPNGFLGPPTSPWIVSTSWRPFLPGNAKAEIAAALSELAQALNDLAYPAFALEILRDLYTAEPNQFRSRIASVQSLRANIFVDLRQNDDAAVAGEEAVTILKEHGETQPELIYAMLNYAVLLGASVDRPVFSFLHGHALFTHSDQLSEANRKGDSYSTIQEAVEIWQNLQSSAPVATRRPLAWALFELAKYRHKGADKQTLRNELQIAETSVSMFREVLPLDYAGLADALYLYADRMLELDNNREAATYAEESVQHFREAREASPQKYALDLIFSLSLASSCLACTERSEDALAYAKHAVEVQHERKDDGDAQYSIHLRKLLMDVVFRSMEMDKEKDALPWMQELSQLGPITDTGNVLARRGGKPQPPNEKQFKKETSFWMDSSNSAPHRSALSLSHTPPPSPQMDKGKGREVTPSAGSSISAPRVDKGKAREAAPGNPFSPSNDTRRLSLAEEEILSPAAAAAAAQRRRDALAGRQSLLGMGGMGGRTLGGATGPTRPGNEDPLSSLLGMGGRTLGGATGTGNNDPLSSLLGAGRMGGRAPAPPSSPPPTGPAGRPLGSPIQQTTRAPPATGRAAGGRLGGMAGLESLLGGLGGLGPGGWWAGRTGQNDKDKADGGNKGTTGADTEGGGDYTPRSGTWSGVGIQSKLSDDST